MQPESEAIDIALHRRIPFYAYNHSGKTIFSAQPDSNYTCGEGFTAVPFDICSTHPTVKIYRQLSAAETIKQCTAIPEQPLPVISSESTTYDGYMQSISECLRQLQSGQLHKVVLSKVITTAHHIQLWGEFFDKLCETYPDAFKFVFFSEATGAWIGATPETLGEYQNSTFTTMALAGTRKRGTRSEWDDKDIREQSYVAQYIADTIRSAGLESAMSERFTKQAGGVEHLCNTFTVRCTLAKARHLATTLHPTPALAGLPKQEAIDLINGTESHDREYYGGYIGPFTETGFHYFVNLRSMKFDNTKCRIYAGGGIVAGSHPQSEWLETESKALTLLSILNK